MTWMLLVAMLLRFRGQYARNGLDGFVWNCWDDSVRRFLRTRASRGAPAFGPWLDFDPIDETESMLLEYLVQHADEVIAQRRALLTQEDGPQNDGAS